jgi:hypothetical protein
LIFQQLLQSFVFTGPLDGFQIITSPPFDYSGEIGHLYQMKSAIGSGGNKAS